VPKGIQWCLESLKLVLLLTTFFTDHQFYAVLGECWVLWSAFKNIQSCMCAYHVIFVKYL